MYQLRTTAERIAATPKTADPKLWLSLERAADVSRLRKHLRSRLIPVLPVRGTVSFATVDRIKVLDQRIERLVTQVRARLEREDAA